MKYLKEFKLFDSYYYSMDDLDRLINEVEDSLDCDFERIRTSYDGISFIFRFSNTKVDEKLLKNKINWFIDSIKKLDKIIIQNKVFSPEFGTEYPYEWEPGKRKAIAIDIRGSFTEIISNLIRDYKIDPEPVKEEVRKFDKNKFIHDLFEMYCRYSLNIDFTILESFRSDEESILTPIKFDDIRLPHNLSEQFKIDITPIFLEKVYKNSGLIFRISLSSKSQFNMVTREDRLRGESIAKETDKKLKELGIDLTWKDIFVKSSRYYNF